MSAANIASALGGFRSGAAWIARCPAHNDRKPSLSICDADEGKILIHCHAGCDQKRVIVALRSRGLWTDNGLCRFRHLALHAAARSKPDSENARRRERALSLWRSTISADGTLVQTYLGSRGLHLPPPPTLRFHAGLKHPLGGVWPAMVALVTRGSDDTPLAVHRTFLTHDGDSKAPVEPQKMMLGSCRGGVVRLAQAGDVLMVGEGIETCLAAMQATAHSAWAALSISGLRTLNLPKDIRDIIILADGDDAGEAAARDAALRWTRERRRVRIAQPPHGLDFNDMLLGRVPDIEEGVQ
jgi:putative DNA primase/helicase